MLALSPLLLRHVSTAAGLRQNQLGRVIRVYQCCGHHVDALAMPSGVCLLLSVALRALCSRNKVEVQWEEGAHATLLEVQCKFVWGQGSGRSATWFCWPALSCCHQAQWKSKLVKGPSKRLEACSHTFLGSIHDNMHVYLQAACEVN